MCHERVSDACNASPTSFWRRLCSFGNHPLLSRARLSLADPWTALAIGWLRGGSTGLESPFWRTVFRRTFLLPVSPLVLRWLVSSAVAAGLRKLCRAYGASPQPTGHVVDLSLHFPFARHELDHWGRWVTAVCARIISLNSTNEYHDERHVESMA